MAGENTVLLSSDATQRVGLSKFEDILVYDPSYESAHAHMRIRHIFSMSLGYYVACDFRQTRIELQVVKPGVLRPMSWKAVTLVHQRSNRCFMSLDRVSAPYCSPITSDRICRPRNKHYGRAVSSLRSISDDERDAARSWMPTPMV
ncbi:uncharacterized protein LOC116842752 [Odontomachus brunneus]|uniref:uncharacterized protein LOC116842752 n=1 Tax=Odontomachus brunneus TaxID=486640 RepID=UPI0013F2023B|nr:uncharacterized protein LOC116842752 [Odontomachus brunneus]